MLNGIPQIVHKVPLSNKPEEHISGISLPEIFDRLIIGPSDYSYTIWEAFVAELEAAGIEEPYKKVVSSGIPLRN